MSNLGEALREPFPAKLVNWRVGSVSEKKAPQTSRAQLLAYIDSRAVQNRLDAVCGPFGWRDSYDRGPAGGVLCCLELKNPETGEWVPKCDGADNTDFASVKGGLSDSFKRAAVAWGIGRYLYYVTSPWVEVQERGKIRVTVGKQPNIRTLGYVNPPELPKWALPSNS